MNTIKRPDRRKTPLIVFVKNHSYEKCADPSTIVTRQQLLYVYVLMTSDTDLIQGVAALRVAIFWFWSAYGIEWQIYVVFTESNWPSLFQMPRRCHYSNQDTFRSTDMTMSKTPVMYCIVNMKLEKLLRTWYEMSYMSHTCIGGAMSVRPQRSVVYDHVSLTPVAAQVS